MAYERVKYEQKFTLEYRDEFRCITKSAFGNTFGLCNLCRYDVIIVHRGHDDLGKHCATEKHLNVSSAAKFQPCRQLLVKIGRMF